MLKKFGTVKNFHTKSSSPFRSSIYVEYSKPEEAEAAIHNLTTLDPTGEKRKIFGDPSCDINYYFKKKFNKENNFNGPMFNNNKNNNFSKFI